MHPIEEAFGEHCSLYTDVLKCSPSADAAQLRKAYYRAALKVHPDKNPDNPEAAKTFQALSLAYQILGDADLRREYDETGVLPHPDATADDVNEEGVDAWKSYFDQIFGKITVSKINDFAEKYKTSDEERRDVLKEFKARKGDLVKMLNFVMLSEPRDAVRWVSDYLEPALQEKDSKLKKWKDNMEKSLISIRKMIDKENKANAKDDEKEVDGDETETESEGEGDEDEKVAKAAPRIGRFQSSPSPQKKAPSKKRKAKASSTNNSMDDLVAQIQNKRRGAGSQNLLSSLGARYGVNLDDDEDPLADADFAKLQSKYKKKARK
jgi:DnaJ family protein C protein 9